VKNLRRVGLFLAPLRRFFGLRPQNDMKPEMSTESGHQPGTYDPNQFGSILEF